jgi:hypothetical protein
MTSEKITPSKVDITSDHNGFIGPIQRSGPIWNPLQISFQEYSQMKLEGYPVKIIKEYYDDAKLPPVIAKPTPAKVKAVEEKKEVLKSIEEKTPKEVVPPPVIEEKEEELEETKEIKTPVADKEVSVEKKEEKKPAAPVIPTPKQQNNGQNQNRNKRR